MTSTIAPVGGNAGDRSSSKRAPILHRDTLKEQYDVSEELGFASESPSAELPDYFKPWSDIAFNLQELFTQRRLRIEVENLPLLDHNELSGRAEWETAYLFLAYITQGYVWQNGEEGVPKVLPKAIAVPYHAASQVLGMPANFNQFNSVLRNWKLRDGKQDMCQENMETLVTLAGGREEQWFFLTGLMVEKECGAALYASVDAQQAVYDEDDVKLKKALAVIAGAVMKMVEQFNRITEGVTRDVFYNVIRVNMSGWSAPAFQKKGLEGLIFEGVSETPERVIGGIDLASSTTLPALDAALGISHEPDEEKLEIFRMYMPPKHVEFVAAISRGPSIRKYVECRENSDIEIAYNKCLEAVQLFRSRHLQVITRYVVVPSRKGGQGENGIVAIGGKGTVKFLKGMRSRTVKAIFSRREPNPSQSTSLLPSYAAVLAIAVVGGLLGAVIYGG